MNQYVMQGMAAGRGNDLRKQAAAARWASLARRARRGGAAEQLTEI